MGFTWPHNSEELIKFVTIAISLAVFIFQLWQSSIKRRAEYNSALVSWGDETISLLHRIANCENTDISKISDQVLDLEIAISRGRLFFPNKRMPGSDHGWRPRILDWLVYTAKLAKSPGLFSIEDRCNLFEQLKRGYIRDLQILLRPTAVSSTMMSLKIQLVLGRHFSKGPMDTSQEEPPIDRLASTFKKRG